MHVAAASNGPSVCAPQVLRAILVGLLDLEAEGEGEGGGLGWDCSDRKGMALSGEHMKGQLRHLGALMTD